MPTREQKILHAQKGHIGETIHEADDSSLSEIRMRDTDIILEAGLGLELNDDLVVIAVSEKGQAWLSDPRIAEGDVLVGYNGKEFTFKDTNAVKEKVEACGGQIDLHFNSMPYVARPSNLCDFVLASKFDIDKGSTLEHAYPTNVPGYESSYFAETMLPEGAHQWEEDWTTFILNRDGKMALDNENNNNSEKEGSGGDAKDEKHMLYCINCIRTSHDKSAKRGAVCKSLCVCSRYHFVHIFKHSIVLALDKYFKSPDGGEEMLQELFHALNSTAFAQQIQDVDASATEEDMSLHSMQYITAIDRKLMKRGVAARVLGRESTRERPEAFVCSTEVRLGKVALPVTIPLHTSTDEVGQVVHM